MIRGILVVFGVFGGNIWVEIVCGCCSKFLFFSKEFLNRDFFIVVGVVLFDKWWKEIEFLYWLFGMLWILKWFLIVFIGIDGGFCVESNFIFCEVLGNFGL